MRKVQEKAVLKEIALIVTSQERKLKLRKKELNLIKDNIFRIE